MTLQGKQGSSPQRAQRARRRGEGPVSRSFAKCTRSSAKQIHHREHGGHGEERECCRGVSQSAREVPQSRFTTEARRSRRRAGVLSRSFAKCTRSSAKQIHHRGTEVTEKSGSVVAEFGKVHAKFRKADSPQRHGGHGEERECCRGVSQSARAVPQSRFTTEARRTRRRPGISSRSLAKCTCSFAEQIHHRGTEVTKKSGSVVAEFGKVHAQFRKADSPQRARRSRRRAGLIAEFREIPAKFRRIQGATPRPAPSVSRRNRRRSPSDSHSGRMRRRGPHSCWCGAAATVSSCLRVRSFATYLAGSQYITWLSLSDVLTSMAGIAPRR